jgi:glycosyltransferase involved in cell wall biosynthesis
MPAATDLFSPGGSREAARLLFVGRLNAQKGVELLLRAVAAMHRHATLDVVGDGPDGPALRELATSLGISGRIVWHGALAQDRLPPLYRRAAALVVPSRDEGLGLVAVEAQLCETPVIAFDSGGLRDIVRDGTSGLLVKEFTPSALAIAIEKLLANSAHIAEFGVAGRRSALATFSPEAVARRYALLYRDVITPRALASASLIEPRIPL